MAAATDFQCALTKRLPDAPVFAQDGNLYDLCAIDAWLDEHGNSPVTLEGMERKYIRPAVLMATYNAFRTSHGLLALTLPLGVLDHTATYYNGVPYCPLFRAAADLNTVEAFETAMRTARWTPREQRLILTDLLPRVCTQKNMATVKFLVEHGAVVADTDALQGARTVEIVQYLVDHGATAYGDVLLDAVYHERYDVLQTLLDCGHATDQNVRDALEVAVKRGDLRALEILHRNGADLHFQDDLCVLYAAQANCPDALVYLLDHGADLTTHGMKAREAANVFGYAAILGVLDNAQM